MTPAACRDSGAFVYHEPWATASRKARLTRPASPQGLKATPSPCVAAVPVTPLPAGLRRRPRHENARSARHENVQASRRGREKARPFSRPFRNHQGKVDLSPDSSGAILLRTALPIAIRSFTLNGPHSISANILVARRWANLARQQYNISQSRMRRSER